MGRCGSDQAPEKDLMQVYREFGLHQFSPSTLVPTHTCGDKRYARSVLYGSGKHFPRPMRCDAALAAPAPVQDESRLCVCCSFLFFGKYDTKGARS